MDVATARHGWLAGALAVAAATAMAVGTIASAPAAAKPDCEKNPDACKVATTGVTSAPSPKFVAARVGKSKCRARTFERWGKSVAGIKLYSWFLDVEWCYRRGRITRATADTRPDTHVPLWSFDKELAFRRSGGARKSFYRVYAQGRFELCITKLGCIQDAQPWIRVVTRGNGSYSFAHGG